MIRRARAIDVLTFERAKKGVIYQKGTIYIQVSATRRNKFKQFFVLEEDGEIETKYVTVTEKVKGSFKPYYLCEVLEHVVHAWYTKYVGDCINIQMDAFKYLEIIYDDDLKVQEQFEQVLIHMDEQIKNENAIIEQLSDIKRYGLHKMFV